jgi:hypothetical protein
MLVELSSRISLSLKGFVFSREYSHAVFRKIGDGTKDATRASLAIRAAAYTNHRWFRFSPDLK